MTVSSSPHLRQQKQQLRRAMETKRQDAAAQNLEAANILRDVFLQTITLPPNSIVASYHKRGTEIDPQPLTDALRARGHVIALPVIGKKKEPLLFHRYQPGDVLVPGHFGTQEPLTNTPAVEPDIFLVPLLAFDRNKGRLGYGGGYYDRTITILRQHKKIITIGLAYSCQEVPAIPMGSFDARLDKIATELQVL